MVKKPSPTTPAQVAVLTPKQAEANALLAGPQRATLLVGGSRSGKTTLIMRAILTRAQRAPFSRHAVLRLRSNAVRASIALDTLPKAARIFFPGLELMERRQDNLFRLPNGSEIYLLGLDDEKRADKILGLEFATIYGNEASQLPYSSVQTARTRLAQQVMCSDAVLADGTVVPGKMLQQREYYDLNPGQGAHWTALMFLKKLDPVSRQPLGDPENYQHMFVNPYDNTANLSADYLRSLENLPERARKRFLKGEYVDDVDGALWTIEGIEACRCEFNDIPADMARVVVAVDPSGHTGAADSRSDLIGISVAGRAANGHAFVFEDATMAGSPEQWGTKVVELYKKYRCDIIVFESNFGGDMVRAVIQAIDPMVPCKPVVASRGKCVRAEPISSLYAPDADGDIRVHHVGSSEAFRRVEDEMLAFTHGSYAGARSPNAADALVFALSELMLGEKKSTPCWA